MNALVPWTLPRLFLRPHAPPAMHVDVNVSALFLCCPHASYKHNVQSLNDALAKKKKELVSARLARTRTTGAGPPGPRSPCPAARPAGMRSRHVQVRTREVIVVRPNFEAGCWGGGGAC